MTETELRNRVVARILYYKNMGNEEAHRIIVNNYNSYTGERQSMSASWCHMTAYVVGYEAGIGDQIPKMAVCTQAVQEWKAKGRFKDFHRSNPGYIPRVGDYVYYWNIDNEPGDEDVDHVGIVTKVTGSTFESVDGNYTGGVNTDTSYAGSYISNYYLYGFGVPDYASIASGDTDPEDEYDIYVVQSGDTLGRIAVSYGLMVAELADYNNIKDVNVIYVGQQLKIPVLGRRDYIKLFQQAINLAKIASLDEDGIWGPLTEAAAANALVRSGTTGTMAYMAQVMLKAYGYISFEPSAEFTSHSTAATILYQRDHNLDADGIIGVNTWKSMLLVS